MALDLKNYGFDEAFLNMYKERGSVYEPARIIAEHKSIYIIACADGEMQAHLSGKYLYTLEEKGGKPTVGDFVLVQIADGEDKAIIHDYLPRKTLFYRYNSFGKMGAQVICANFDTVFICMSLNNDFNTSRLERYLLMAKESGGEAVVVLTKADLCPDPPLYLSICQAIAGEASVYCVSAYDSAGLSDIKKYFGKGRTVVALGSSGVGKSTLINALSGEELMRTSEIREDDSRGRHTTTHRQLIMLSSGGLYIDTPGMRELGLHDASEAVDEFYSDIEDLALQYRFKDCEHKNEPGCAVNAAIANGDLRIERKKKYVKYKREAMYVNDRAQYMEMQKKIFKKIISNNKKI